MHNDCKKTYKQIYLFRIMEHPYKISLLVTPTIRLRLSEKC